MRTSTLLIAAFLSIGASSISRMDKHFGITFGGATTVTPNCTGCTATATVPPTTRNGDTMIAFATTATTSCPVQASWTSVANTTTATGFMLCSYRRLASSEPTTYAFTSCNNCTVQIADYHGVNTTNPINGTSVSDQAAVTCVNAGATAETVTPPTEWLVIGYGSTGGVGNGADVTKWPVDTIRRTQQSATGGFFDLIFDKSYQPNLLAGSHSEQVCWGTSGNVYEVALTLNAAGSRTNVLLLQNLSGILLQNNLDIYL